MLLKALLIIPVAALALASLPSCQSGDASDGGGEGGAQGPSSSGGHGGEGAHGPSASGGHGGEGGAAHAADPCCVLGAICHVPGGADDPAIDECHILGHENVLSACEENYDRCYALCHGITDDPEVHACE